LVWARTSVCAGGFDLAAAEDVFQGGAIPDGAVWESVESLVTKSVLSAEQVDGANRYRMLDTLQTYGRDRLRETDAEPSVQRRHRDWFLQLAESCEADAAGPDQLMWLGILARDHANLRAALDFCAARPGEAQAGLRLVSALWFYWFGRGLHAEAGHWFDRLLRELGDRRFDDAVARGHRLDFDEAVACCLDEPPASSPASRPPAPAAPQSPLTRRERQVAELVAEGLSNSQIAERLIISQRTAESHVERIFNKLGFGARAQIAVWVTEHETPT
jgi:DNA-binding CsgD family transcriptional regulator